MSTPRRARCALPAAHPPPAHPSTCKPSNPNATTKIRPVARTPLLHRAPTHPSARPQIQQHNTGEGVHRAHSSSRCGARTARKLPQSPLERRNEYEKEATLNGLWRMSENNTHTAQDVRGERLARKPSQPAGCTENNKKTVKGACGEEKSAAHIDRIVGKESTQVLQTINLTGRSE
jgi:hypothetical protein